MRMRGWVFTGEAPTAPKFVAIAAPHTTNWDFVIFLAVASTFRIPARAIGKGSLVRWPFGRLMRRLGIIPVERDTGQGLVEQMVGEFARSERMALVIAPEGTRGRAEYWRSGFYRIAMAADVPVLMTYIDFPSKRAGLGPLIRLSGDVAADMDQIRSFYSGYRGKQRGNESRIRLREENDAR